MLRRAGLVKSWGTVVTPLELGEAYHRDQRIEAQPATGSA
jgi:hypothetical protein